MKFDVRLEVPTHGEEQPSGKLRPERKAPGNLADLLVSQG